jgi:hypothetical protein
MRGRTLALMTRVVSLCIFALLLASTSSATTYYVDCNAGSDSNAGTSTGTAWATVGKVNSSSFSAGDSILFIKGCTWRAQLIPPSSGSAGNPITFGAYGSGAAPILSGNTVVTGWSLVSGSIYSATVAWDPNMTFEDGTSLTLETSTGAMIAGSYYWAANVLNVWTADGSSPAGHTMEASHYPIVTAGNTAGDAGLINVTSVNYVAINGLDIHDSNYYGIRSYVTTNLTVTNSSFENCFQNCITGYEGGGGVTNSSNLTVTGNTFSGCGVNRPRGGSEGLCINLSTFQTALASQNDIVSGYGECIQTGGGDSNITITENLIASCASTPIYISEGYENGGDTTNVVVSYNFAYTPGENEPYVITLETTYNINGVEMFGNVGVCNSGALKAGILFGNLGVGTGTIENVTVANNSLYGCFIGMEANGPTSNATNVFENNIAYGSQYGWYQGDTNTGNYTIDYNDIYAGGSSTTVHWLGTDYTLAAFKTAFPALMTHSISADPQYVNPGSQELYLQSSSPAINAGTNLGSTYQNGLSSSSAWPASVITVNQNSFDGWAIGAFVSGTVVSKPNPPTNLTATVQ